MGLGGLEPPTSRLSGVRSNQLSYRPTPRSVAEEIEPAETVVAPAPWVGDDPSLAGVPPRHDMAPERVGVQAPSRLQAPEERRTAHEGKPRRIDLGSAVRRTGRRVSLERR